MGDSKYDVETPKFAATVTYRKRPVEIQAVEFQPNRNPWPEGVKTTTDPRYPQGFIIDTLENVHEVTPGDWIVTGIKGERYPVKPDIFKETYERVSQLGSV